MPEISCIASEVDDLRPLRMGPILSTYVALATLFVEYATFSGTGLGVSRGALDKSEGHFRPVPCRSEWPGDFGALEPESWSDPSAARHCRPMGLPSHVTNPLRE